MKTSRIAMSTWRWEKGIEEGGREGRMDGEGMERWMGGREGGMENVRYATRRGMHGGLKHATAVVHAIGETY